MDSISELKNVLENSNDDQNQELSYIGRSLKLDSADSAKVITEGLRNCKCLTTFNLDGNTIGVEASIEIGKGLENHPEFKNAIWKNMFTGRTKEEIPMALRHMFNGVIIANAKLVVLDLSDNAFGPIGVDGLTELFASECCFTLKELILNNNGLGIHGANMLAERLLKCHQASGGKFALTTFISGRNRLENSGAIALSRVFTVMKSLKVIRLPQNGIYYVGIKALCDAFAENPDLVEINLNDNTLNIKGAQHLSEILPKLKHLEILNIGDCLIKSKGAKLIATGIQEGSDNLKTLILDENEIKLSGILEIVSSINKKSKIEVVSLSGNEFGVNGVHRVFSQLKEINKEHVLQIDSDNEEENSSFPGDDIEEISDDESDDESDVEEIDNNGIEKESVGDSDAELKQTKYEEESDDEEEDYINNYGIRCSLQKQHARKIVKFLHHPTSQTFSDIGFDHPDWFIEYISMYLEPQYYEEAVHMLIKISNLCKDDDVIISEAAINTSVLLYGHIFGMIDQDDAISFVNYILAHLRLIKAEDPKCLVMLNKEAAMIPLFEALECSFIPEHAASVIKFVISNKQ